MVIGIDKIKEYFSDFEDSYIIIGGTACDLILEGTPVLPRATKDIDIVLIIEAMTADFGKRFWQFINDGQYIQRQRSTLNKASKTEFYRFIKPEKDGFPKILELFSRRPEILGKTDFHLTPIPIEESISSLSAILLNNDYYNYIVENSQIIDGIHIANVNALICLKAKAFLELKERSDKGEHVDAHDLLKHRVDIIKLMTTLSANTKPFTTSEMLHKDILSFVQMNDDLPTQKSIIDSTGLSQQAILRVWELFKHLFS